MSTIPHYRDQPSTLDPNQPIPEDAPLAQGHTEEKAAEVAEAAATYAEVTQEQEQADAEAAAKAEADAHEASAKAAKPEKAEKAEKADKHDKKSG